ncbi:MurR/RpiR family transcriptional regulator [Paenibacillus beijingensis]|uniref:RpiR family transcriptional regulator n=1 Tax=Paenibacillus beijingensis TaxID=1126833 RepID=A0A0D5NP85_9BACL|nr:MurR/RpiR family transcriptional regulator [Paenibacillus beijingensis]AJY76980.1 hypothetical protein VN24_23505 [Paenibacillus beijingensis]
MQTSAFENLAKEKFNELSVSQKKVAEYILENLERAALSTAVQIAREVEVSETTVIRLSYALGFSSFSAMQQTIKQKILQSANDSVEYERKDIPVNESNMFARVVENEIAILKQALHQLDVAEICKMADAIHKADQVVIVGNRAAYTEAYWFSFMLGKMRENVHLCPSVGGNNEKLFYLTDQSAVVAISFPRYSRDTLMVTEHAKSQGATIIAVTDRLLSPIGRISDITLLTDVNMDADTGIGSTSSVISLLHAVMIGVNLKDQERIRARHQSMEQFYAKHHVFVE